MINNNKIRFAALLGSCLAAVAAQAHECRLVGNGNENVDSNFDKRYYICLGFLHEEPTEGQPGKGKPNNLDFLPVYFEDVNTPVPLNAAKGDKVEIEATVYWLNGRVFPTSPQEVPAVGYESPIALTPAGKIRWKHTIAELVQRKSGGLPSYGEKNDFILPYRGMYAWVVQGTLQHQGAKPVTSSRNTPASNHAIRRKAAASSTVPDIRSATIAHRRLGNSLRPRGTRPGLVREAAPKPSAFHCSLRPRQLNGAEENL